MKISFRERKLIEAYRKLSVKDREYLYQIALAFFSDNQSDSSFEKRLILRITSSILMIGRRNSSFPSFQVY